MKVDATPAYNRIVRVLITAQPLFIDLISLCFSPPRMDNVLIKVDSSKLDKGINAWQALVSQGFKLYGIAPHPTQLKVLVLQGLQASDKVQ